MTAIRRVELVGPVQFHTPVREQPAQGAMHDGCSDLALDVVAHDGQSGGTKLLGPLGIRREEDRHAIDHRHTRVQACLGVVTYSLLGPDRQITDQHLGIRRLKTPEAFRNACTRFIYVDNLIEAGADKENGEAASPAAARKESPSKAVKIIARAIEDSDDDGWVNLSVVGSRITGAAPDFDARTYRVPEPEHACREIRRFRGREGAGRGDSYPPQGGGESGGR